MTLNAGIKTENSVTSITEYNLCVSVPSGPMIESNVSPILIFRKNLDFTGRFLIVLSVTFYSSGVFALNILQELESPVPLILLGRFHS